MAPLKHSRNPARPFAPALPSPAVTKYNEEMAAEIALTKRATYKAEGKASEAEKVKIAQDLYIDSLTSKVRLAGEKLARLEAAVSTQRAQTSAATATVAEATAEMEAIRVEKKALLQQWLAARTVE